MDRGIATVSIARTARSQAAAMLAFFAIFLHIAVPALYDMAPPGVQGLMEMTICAGGESKQVLMDQSGKPVKDAPASKHDCKSCLSHCGALALSSAAVALPLFAALLILPLTSGLPHGLIALNRQARAPPL